MMTLCVLLTTIPCLEMMLFSGTAMYSQIDSYPGNPYSSNSTGVEITVIFGICHSPHVPLGQFSQTLSDLLISQSSQFTLLIGDLMLIGSIV